MEIRESLDRQGRSPFAQWFENLNAPAAAKVTVAVARMELGNFSNSKSVGEDVFEYGIDFGPGYRIYFGKDGETIVILVAGGTKNRQHRDIDDAKRRWQEYKDRRKAET
jgi:putative addiction module killer protein